MRIHYRKIKKDTFRKRILENGWRPFAYRATKQIQGIDKQVTMVFEMPDCYICRFSDRI